MSETPPTDYASLADEIAGWLRFQMDQVGAARLVLGLSGGIDSAVVCALSTMAAGPSRVIAAIMPIHSRSDDVRDAELVASRLRGHSARDRSGARARCVDRRDARRGRLPVWKTQTSTRIVSPYAVNSRWPTSSLACA